MPGESGASDVAVELGQGLPRSVEILIAAAGLALAWPLLVVAGLLVKVSSPGPILFRQVRLGQGGREFTLLKFRSMRIQEGGPGFTAQGDSRITAIGRLLRKTKLDELPELWNILLGDMSFVGPRPEVPQYIDLADPRWRKVLEARPGLTDPVTLRLRNEEELLASVGDDRPEFYLQVLVPYKLKGYLDYLSRRSALSDIEVLLATVWAVLSPSSVPPPSRAEVESVVDSTDAEGQGERVY